MIYGMYLSAQAAEAQAFRQSVMANNMANAGTNGFKTDHAIFRAHLAHDLMFPGPAEAPDTFNDQTGGVSIEGTVTNFSQAALNSTNAPLDVALVGPGFLQVSDGQSKFLTRNGRFTLNAEGGIVTSTEGHAVLDSEGEPLVVPPGATQLMINRDGLITARDTAGGVLAVGQLAVVEPVNPNSMLRRGTSYFEPAEEPVPSPMTSVRQGYIEASGSDPVLGTVEMVETNRAFEMNMNLIKLQDESLGQLLQSLPRR